MLLRSQRTHRLSSSSINNGLCFFIRNFDRHVFMYIIAAVSLTSASNNCFDRGNFTGNSAYAKNRNITLSFLPSNVSENRGFFWGTIGQDSDKVYALGFCRGDSSPEACFTCVKSLSQGIVKECPDEIEAYAWDGDPPCLIRYSNTSFLGEMSGHPTDAGYNTADIKINLEKFEEVWGAFINKLIAKAASGSPELKYAAGDTYLDSFLRIYAVLQCTPDLSKNDCQSCLQEAVSDFQTCCYGKQGGYVSKPSCLLRWDLYPFLQTPAHSFPPSPASSPNPSSLLPLNRNFAKDDGKDRSRTTVIVIIPAVICVAVVALSFAILRKWKRRPWNKGKRGWQEWLNDRISRSQSSELPINGRKPEGDEGNTDVSFFDLETISAATDHFSAANRLGKGGFGSVYRGKLATGMEIAVKRLSKNSGQGVEECKNEIRLIAKLQHRNLVRLLGCCIEDEEKMLIYEYLPNRSLDIFLFDETKRLIMDWTRRYDIIFGIARGILYLHEDSRLKIVHRDLKASNVLLDAAMNPKISDFGMARIFGENQQEASTNRIVGTYGYMSPEYAMEGSYSIKSDVFSFGVLLLEIICGKRNTSYDEQRPSLNLIGHVWHLWREGKALDIIDTSLDLSYSKDEILRCIHVGLLCVQESAKDRPTMLEVIFMIGNETPLPSPTRPAFILRGTTSNTTPKEGSLSTNEITVSTLEAR